jgi:uncharacterized C2H2 Zn-finger protein
MNFHCKQCDKQFDYQYELIVHRFAHKVTKFNKDDIQDENKENIFRCELCDTILINQDHLINHVAQHDKGILRRICAPCKVHNSLITYRTELCLWLLYEKI